MKGKKTGLNKNELKMEILNRMNALNISNEEYSNTELLKDYEELIKTKP